MVIAAVTVAVVFLLAILFDAPLKDIANPNLTPQVAKAPWYFAGFQELLRHLQPMVAGVIVPAAAVALLMFRCPIWIAGRAGGSGSQGRRRRVQRGGRRGARVDRDRHLLPWAGLVLGLAVAAPVRGALIDMTDETQHDLPEDIDRRRFLNGTWKVLGVALVAEAAWTSYDILHPRPAAGFGGGVAAGNVADYAEEGPFSIS